MRNERAGVGSVGEDVEVEVRLVLDQAKRLEVSEMEYYLKDGLL